MSLSNNIMVMFLDVETVPSQRAKALFDIPEEPAEGFTHPTILQKMSVDAIKEYLTKYAILLGDTAVPVVPVVPDALTADPIQIMPYLDLLFSLESSDKGRAGVFAAITKAEEAVDEWVTLHSTTPELCEVISLSWAFNTEEPHGGVVGQKRTTSTGREIILTEANLLIQFWKEAYRATKFVGYNVTFDLEVINARSAFLRLKPQNHTPILLAIAGQPWKAGDIGAVVDLWKFRFPHGSKTLPKGHGGLKSIAGLNGIDPIVPDMDGSMVAKLYAAGELDTILKYNKSDVDLCQRLARYWQNWFIPDLFLPPLEVLNPHMIDEELRRIMEADITDGPPMFNMPILEYQEQIEVI